MPIGILIIIKMPSPAFFTADELAARIKAYFSHIEGEFHLEMKPGKNPEDGTSAKKVWDREPEPATITGLALFIGFNSRDEFNDYEENGEFAVILKRGHLCIEAIYEKKLHQQSPTGAIFALKSMGWNEKAENLKPTDMVRFIKVKIIESGPQPVSSEKEVVL